jgi:hypothetical protein
MKNQSVKLKQAKTTSSRMATALECAKAGLHVASVYGVTNDHCRCGGDCGETGGISRLPPGSMG